MTFPPLTWRQRANRMVRRRRAALIKRLGAHCRACGKTINLQFHHPDGRPYIPERLARHNRIAAYEKDVENGNLELLCRSCHSRRTMLDLLNNPNYLPI